MKGSTRLIFEEGMIKKKRSELKIGVQKDTSQRLVQGWMNDFTEAVLQAEVHVSKKKDPQGKKTRMNRRGQATAVEPAIKLR